MRWLRQRRWPGMIGGIWFLRRSWFDFHYIMRNRPEVHGCVSPEGPPLFGSAPQQTGIGESGSAQQTEIAFRKRIGIVPEPDCQIIDCPRADAGNLLQD